MANLTPEQRADLIRRRDKLRQEGLTHPVIAARLGYSVGGLKRMAVRVAQDCSQEAQRKFNEGDRVRLVEAAGWRDRDLARMAASRRAGTVIGIFGTAIPANERGYYIRFDVGRAGVKPVERTLNAGSLELARDAAGKPLPRKEVTHAP